MVDLSKVEEALGPLMAQEAAELVDLRYAREGGRWVLRVYVDKPLVPGGTGLRDCEYLSDRIGSLLEGGGLLPPGTTLEVSSPGLDRVLKKEKDFIRFLGRRVQVRLKLPEEGRSQFKGVLRSYREGVLGVECDQRAFQWPLSRVLEARLVPEI